MKYKALLILILISSFTLLSALSIKKDNLSLRCMLQMKNYSGHGAYIVISLLDENKEYKKTLRILGDDREWYNEIEEWWKFFGKERRNIDGITGATLSGGERKIIALNIPQKNPDYYLRFETAVEEQKYYPSEIDIKISQLETTKKYNGDGYIRYLKFIQQ